MIWTTEKPTHAGWYWYRFNEIDDAQCVHVFWPVQVNAKYLCVAAIGSLNEPIQEWFGQWAGPLDPPE